MHFEIISYSTDINEREENIKKANLIVYVCGCEEELNYFSNEIIDFEDIKNINLITIGQNIFHDELYRLQIQFGRKSCYIMFDRNNRNSLVQKSISQNNDFGEEKSPLISTNKYRLFKQLENFLDRCLYEDDKVKKPFSKRLLLVYIRWRFRRLMKLNEFELVDEFNRQPVLENFLNYKSSKFL